MPVDDAPEDDEVRETYNFAPGYHGLVYRADVPHRGAGADEPTDTAISSQDGDKNKFRLQTMKWGLIPFWTKRNPDYGSMMKTINARDDSLAARGGMWNTMKQKKRCVVLAQGFYEWLKKNGGREKVPHFVKRSDGQLMCFAGLWDCVQYEGSEEKHYTYTIITTDSNQQLKFLHDRMPVILNNGSENLRTWLDAGRSEWSKDLQMLLKPFDGPLDCYPVSKDVGKVGNDSPTFVVPVDSAENKNNIANFFSAKSSQPKPKDKEDRQTVDHEGSEDNAPLPILKRPHEDDDSKSRSRPKTRSATSNGTIAKAAPKPNGTPKITAFMK